MRLQVKWVDATRPRNIAAKVETEIEEFVLDHFGGASSAFNMKVAFEQQCRPANHPWTIGINKAIAMGTRGLDPLDKKTFHCVFSWFDD